MKFSKWNNPRKKHSLSFNRSPYSESYKAEKRREAELLAAQASTPERAAAILEACELELFPYRTRSY